MHKPALCILVRPSGDKLQCLLKLSLPLLLLFLGRFGCKYRSMNTGIIYNNEMADFDTPDNNIVDGISPSPFNFPAPGKRPFSSMSPAILIDGDGKVKLVIGASGGKRITTAVSLVCTIIRCFSRRNQLV